MPKKLSEHDPITRHQMIFNILRQRTSEESAMSVSEMYAALVGKGIKTCEKTVKRDLEKMESTHKLFATEEKKGKRYYRDEEYDPDYQLTFHESELITMALALQNLREMSDQFQRSLCERTESILLGKLPKTVAQDFQKLKSLTIVTAPFRSIVGVEDKESYAKVMKALSESRVIRCRNNSPYKDKEYRKVLRTYSPLKLNMSGSEQYLFAVDHDDWQVKRLKICRLKDLQILDQKIDKSKMPSVDELDASIGGYGGPGTPVKKYVIHCNELMAILFQEKMMHPSQKVEEKNGEFIITFEANPSVEITRYLAGWAEYIDYVEPIDVFEDMKKIWEAGIKSKSGKKVA